MEIDFFTDFFEIYSHWSNYWCTNSGSDNGLGDKSLSETNDSLVKWHIYTLLGLFELNL